MKHVVDDVEALWGAGGVQSDGHVIDTVGMHSLVYEVRWKFDVAPDALYFAPLGTNDASIAPDIPIPFDTRHSNLALADDGKIADASRRETGRGFIVLKDMPRYVAVATYAKGTFKSSSITLRAYGWGR